eukprot:g30910.t1
MKYPESLTKSLPHVPYLKLAPRFLFPWTLRISAKSPVQQEMFEISLFSGLVLLVPSPSAPCTGKWCPTDRDKSGVGRLFAAQIPSNFFPLMLVLMIGGPPAT